MSPGNTVSLPILLSVAKHNFTSMNFICYNASPFDAFAQFEEHSQYSEDFISSFIIFLTLKSKINGKRITFPQGKERGSIDKL